LGLTFLPSRAGRELMGRTGVLTTGKWKEFQFFSIDAFSASNPLDSCIFRFSSNRSSLAIFLCSSRFPSSASSHANPMKTPNRTTPTQRVHPPLKNTGKMQTTEVERNNPTLPPAVDAARPPNSKKIRAGSR